MAERLCAREAIVGGQSRRWKKGFLNPRLRERGRKRSPTLSKIAEKVLDFGWIMRVKSGFPTERCSRLGIGVGIDTVNLKLEG
jgi:hypothetical protein